MENNPDFGWWEEEDELNNEVEDWEVQDQEEVQLIVVSGIEYNGHILVPDNEQEAFELVKCLAAIAIDMNQNSDKLIWPVYEVAHKPKG